MATESTYKTTVFGKVVLIVILGAFVTLSCLIASLPIYLPSNQETLAESTTKLPINHGDTAWMIVATILSFLLSPVLAYFYSIFFGYNATKVVKNVLILASMITFVWIVFSFSLIYGSDANRDNILGYPKDFYMFHNVSNHPNELLAPTIPLNIFAVFELAFAIVTPTIVTVALWNRVKFSSLLIFFFFWHLAIYSPIASIAWNPHGYFANNKVEDFSGGVVISILASTTIIAANTYLKIFKIKTPKVVAPKNQDDLVFTTLFVFILWFALNAGKAHAANGTTGQSIVNTIAATTASIFFNYIINAVLEKNFSAVNVINSILIGLVVATPSSGLVAIGGSIIITLICVIVNRVYNHFLKVDEENSISILSLHGIIGTIAFLLTAMFEYKYINPAGQNGLTYGEVGPIRYQLVAVLLMWSCGLIANFILFAVVDFFHPIRLSQDEITEVEVESELEAEAQAEKKAQKAAIKAEKKAQKAAAKAEKKAQNAAEVEEVKVDIEAGPENEASLVEA